MARRKREDRGEKRTAFIGFQVTPSERATLEEGAAKAGTHLSQHARELCLRRSGEGQIVAKTRRNPAAASLLNELAAIGNNINQLSRHCNTERSAPQLNELKQTTDLIAAAVARVLAL